MTRSPSRYDAVVVGAGHNGLVTACYLGRAGLRVLVLERREVVGGACVTEETFPGFKVSTAAYVNSLFRKEIVRDLKLADYGFRVLPRDPSSFTPLPDGRFLLLGPDAALTLREIGKLSRRDAERYPRYEAMLERVAGVVEPALAMTPPDLLKPGARDLLSLLSLGRAFRRLGPAASEVVEVLTGPARAILDRWFESEALKATLATDAIIGAMASPSTPGTAYVLLHHVMGETEGRRGVWGYVQGGMGGLTQALAAAARDLGVEIRCGAEVERILVRDGAATGVAKYGRPSARPVLECTIPSVVDPTVAPPGLHLMSIFVQYAPYRLREGGWDDLGEAFADRCFDLVDEYAPNFSRSVIARQVLTPLDLERTFNLTGGNIFQGAMVPSQLFSFRPVPGYAGYRTPIRGLYLCGAAAHPGGGVMGVPGMNAAREILGRHRLARVSRAASGRCTRRGS